MTIAEFLLALQSKGQVRFMGLLEKAVSRQVLRQAGTVHRFGPAELEGTAEHERQSDELGGVRCFPAVGERSTVTVGEGATPARPA